MLTSSPKKFSLWLSRLVMLVVAIVLVILLSSLFRHSRLMLGNSSHAKVNPSIIIQREKNNHSSTQPPPEASPVSTPTYPSPKNCLSAEELRSFPGGSVIESADIEGRHPGESVRVRILKTNFKYPYLRTEELFDTTTGLLITREIMVANHLLVTLPSQEESEAFLNRCGPDALRLERVTTTTPLYRLILRTPSLRSLPEALWYTHQEEKTGLISEPDFLREAFLSPNPFPVNDPYYSSQWELSPNIKNHNLLFPDGINAPGAWKIRTSAASVIAAVIDTGIYYSHEDLADNMWHNPLPTCNDIYGCNTIFLNDRSDVDGENSMNLADNRLLVNTPNRENFIDLSDVRHLPSASYSGDPMDLADNSPYQGHGTACAGIIGAVGNNGIGITGIAWQIQLMACKFFDPSGRGADSDAVICIDYACEHGAKILNCSWGHQGEYSETLFQAMKRAQHQGVIIVIAAGNDAANNDTIAEYPANYKLDNIVVVASTNENDELAHSSNYGVNTVHLGAPGVSIYSTSVIANNFFGHPYYSYMSGTSVAAPHVTGALALMIAEFPTLSYQEIIAKLLAATDPIPALEGKTIAGRLNIAKALEPL